MTQMGHIRPIQSLQTNIIDWGGIAQCPSLMRWTIVNKYYFLTL